MCTCVSVEYVYNMYVHEQNITIHTCSPKSFTATHEEEHVFLTFASASSLCCPVCMCMRGARVRL